MRTLVKTDAGRSIRPASFPLFRTCVAALALSVLPATAHAQFAASQYGSAQYASPQVEAALRSASKSDRELRAFYQARAYRPLWIQGNQIGPEADRLLELIETADLDGLDPDDFRARALISTLRKTQSGSPKALAKAEMQLSRTFAQYVRAVRQPREVGMHYVDKELAPTAPTLRSALDAAAAAPSFAQYMEAGGWMHPTYIQLRRAYLAQRSNPGSGAFGDRQAELLRVNLERARVLPAASRGRHIVVDAASARLWMYEDGRVRDSMKVVVGKPSEQTPMMAGLIRFAMVNPYWNLPPDLARLRVAQEVLKHGPSVLRTKRFEVLSDWSDKAKVLKPAAVDWKALAEGRKELPVRQLPGKNNAMGKMKFMFPNELGIYLHDTPERELFAKAERRFSSGCVRVEDAQRLAKWLFGKPLVPRSSAPEQQMNLPEPVPVYITYFTASPQATGVAFLPDAYNRDGAQLARLGGRSYASR